MSHLNCFVGEVFALINVLGSFETANDVVSPFNARVVVFIDIRWSLLCEAHTVEQGPEVLDFCSNRQCRIVFYLSC